MSACGWEGELLGFFITEGARPFFHCRKSKFTSSALVPAPSSVRQVEREQSGGFVGGIVSCSSDTKLKAAEPFFYPVIWTERFLNGCFRSTCLILRTFRCLPQHMRTRINDQRKQQFTGPGCPFKLNINIMGRPEQPCIAWIGDVVIRSRVIATRSDFISQ